LRRGHQGVIGDDERVTGREGLHAALRAAAAGDGLVLHLMPEVDLASGTVVGMTALPRISQPGSGLLWPAEFLAAAEESRLDSPIGWDLVRRCIRELAIWQTSPMIATAPPTHRRPWQLWVPLGVGQLLEPDFAPRVRDLLAEAGVPPGRLGIEIGDAVLAMGSFALRLISDLHAAGAAVGIGSVTAWYARVAVLGDTPIEMVTLDQDFVRGAGADLAGDGVVGAIVDLAHARGLRVVADGVESWSEGARLCELGANTATGYLFSGPQLPDHARLMLAHGGGWRAPGATLIGQSGRR
jgi:EAL domain-containing protein (putative c-di-GMP-specific phosphodiesterase class I)